MHCINPPALIRSSSSSAASRRATTVAQVRAAAEAMGKTVAESRDVPGFLANRMLLPMLNEAAFCLYEGVGDAEAIDTVMRLGMNDPLGPLALADLIGLDTCLAILEVLQDGFGDPKFRPARCGASTSRRDGSAARRASGSTTTATPERAVRGAPDGCAVV